ncbi:hypothetical protein ACTL6U_04465 [Rhodovibrionaceae bacterium A322]
MEKPQFFTQRVSKGFGQKLDSLPLFEERYYLLIRRRDFFEASVQHLLTFTCSSIFNERVEALQGYDVSHLGRIHYNGL